MLDQVPDGLPRIALVYGQAAAVEHVRDAVAGLVEVAYVAAAGEFDVQRMAAVHATTALVNLDDGDWLDGIEAALEQAGMAVVYNDPEISRGLDGWERARWLRHLVAKLSGSHEFDPPRPAIVAPSAPVAAGEIAEPVPEPETIAGNAANSAAQAAPPAAAVAAMPLSTEEIESMSVALVAEQEPVMALLPEGAAAAPQSTADLMTMDMAVDEAAAFATSMRPAVPIEPDAVQSAPAASFDSDNGLDVDTETLSAMIDARLAEPEAAVPSDSPQVWRVVEGGATSPVQLADAAVPAVAVTAAMRASEPAMGDDADVLASLPSLDDWALVDPDVPVAKAAAVGGKVPEPALPDSLAGLELVPMEMITTVQVHTDPIERWLHDSEPVKPHAESNAARESGGRP